METALNKIIIFFKKTCENILYVFLNILNKTKEEESMKNNMPISDIEYFDTLINFLLDNSNNHSSINFCTRLEELYLNSINSFNVTKPKEEEIFKSNHFSSIDVMDDSGRNIIQTEMRNKGSNW